MNFICERDLGYKLNDYPVLNSQVFKKVFYAYKYGNEEPKTSVRDWISDYKTGGSNLPLSKNSAKEILILCNTRLVISRVNEAKIDWEKDPHDPVDYVMEGFTGLQTALDKYDSSVGEFSTYAVRWIDKAIQTFQQNFSRMINIPIFVQEAMGKIKSLAASIEEKTGREVDYNLLESIVLEESERVSFGYELPEVIINSEQMTTVKNINTGVYLKALDAIFLLNTCSLDIPLGEDQEGSLQDIYISPEYKEEEENKKRKRDILDIAKRILPTEEYNVLSTMLIEGISETEDIANFLNYGVAKTKHVKRALMSHLREDKEMKELWTLL